MFSDSKLVSRHFRNSTHRVAGRGRNARGLRLRLGQAKKAPEEHGAAAAVAAQTASLAWYQGEYPSCGSRWTRRASGLGPDPDGHPRPDFRSGQRCTDLLAGLALGGAPRQFTRPRVSPAGMRSSRATSADAVARRRGHHAGSTHELRSMRTATRHRLFPRGFFRAARRLVRGSPLHGTLWRIDPGWRAQKISLSAPLPGRALSGGPGWR